MYICEYTLWNGSNLNAGLTYLPQRHSRTKIISALSTLALLQTVYAKGMCVPVYKQKMELVGTIIVKYSRDHCLQR